MEKTISTFKKRILKHLEHDKYQPLRQHELISCLDIPSSGRSNFRRALSQLEQEGSVVKLRKNRWALSDGQDTLRCTLQVHHNGFAFAVPEDPDEPDAFIPAKYLGSAIDGDVVLLKRVDPQWKQQRQRGKVKKASSDQLQEGRIIKVLSRRREQAAGRLVQNKRHWFVLPDNRSLPDEIHVTGFELEKKYSPASDRQVVVRLEPWDPHSMKLRGVVIEDLGHANDPAIRIKSLMKDKGISDTFAQKVKQAADQTQVDLSKKSMQERKDIRDLLLFTIDPEDAKDFDDAVSFESDSSNRTVLGVHIADVSHYVQPGSDIDLEAYSRGNSIYLVDRVIPMLPNHLTTDVCSLNPEVDRLAYSVFMTLNSSGDIEKIETTPTLIHSKRRFTYDDIQAIFDKSPEAPRLPEPVYERICNMRTLAARLRKKRAAAGAVMLEMPEVSCEIDNNGRPVRLYKRTAKEAYQLIEEFMLMANIAVAHRLQKAAVPALFRVHPEPDDDVWKHIEAELHQLGIAATVNNQHDANACSKKASGTAQEYIVNLTILRNMKRASYSPVCDGHFGLAFDAYTHFTSPIRRYPDLVVHRILRALDNGTAPPCSLDELKQIAAHCSQTEREADNAEKESLTVKRLEYFQSALSQGDIGPYEAYISKLAQRGMIVELKDSLQQGLVPLHLMRDDHYTVAPDGSSMKGRKTGQVYRPGDTVQVDIAAIDERKQMVDFILHGEKRPSEQTDRNKKKPRRSAGGVKSSQRRPRRRKRKG